jgi:hypothetical protein
MMNSPVAIPDGCPVPPEWPPPPDWFDRVVVALSNGKDSRCVWKLALDTYPRDRIIALYNLLGNEHPGSPQQAGTLCREAGVPLVYTWKERQSGRFVSCWGPKPPPDNTLLDLVVELAQNRARWSDAANPLCTSTGKKDCSNVLLRAKDDDLVCALALQRKRWPTHSIAICTARGKSAPSDVLLRSSCMEIPDLGPTADGRRILLLSGERAEESPRRARKSEWEIRTNATAPTLGRLVLWHRPVLHWTQQQVWDFLHQAALPASPDSYAQGFSRHSCLCCIHRSFCECVLAFTIDPAAAALRVAVEEKIGHRVRLSYFYCTRCGCAKSRQRQGQQVCANCNLPAENGHRGYRAVWEFTFGDWTGIPDTLPSPRASAVAALDKWKRDGQLFRIEDWSTPATPRNAPATQLQLQLGGQHASNVL